MSAQVVVWHTKLGPYHVARLRALARLRPDTLVVEVASREAKYGFWSPLGESLDFRTATLLEGSLERIPRDRQIAAAKRCLTQADPRAVVVAGYALAVMRAVAAWARRRGRLVVLMSDSTHLDARRWRWREWPKRWFVSRFHDCAFVSGLRAAQYVNELGISEQLIWRGCDVVDNDHFRAGADAARARADELRATLQLPARYFLYVGRLAPEKNVPLLLQAYDLYQRSGGDWGLVLVGEGPLGESLRALSRRQGLVGVHWVGGKQYHELPAYYGLASCFVLPSIREPWGLVVNEAQAAGLPVVVSTRCGCAPELVYRGVNGYLFEPSDAEGLAGLMSRMSSGDVDLDAFGRASRRIISMYTPETWAQALADCIDTVCERPSPCDNSPSAGGGSREDGDNGDP